MIERKIEREREEENEEEEEDGVKEADLHLCSSQFSRGTSRSNSEVVLSHSSQAKYRGRKIR